MTGADYLHALAAVLVVVLVFPAVLLVIASLVVGVTNIPWVQRNKGLAGWIAYFLIAGGVGFWWGMGPSGLPLRQAIFAGVLAPLAPLAALAIFLFAEWVATKGQPSEGDTTTVIAMLSSPAVAVALAQVTQAGLPLAPTAFFVIVTAFTYHKFGDRFWEPAPNNNRNPPSASYAPTEDRQDSNLLRKIHALLNNMPPKIKVVALLSMVLFPFSIYLIVAPGFEKTETQFAYAIFGIILGFWLKFPKAGYLTIVVLPVCLYIIVKPGLFDDTIRSLAFSTLAALLGVLLK